MGIAEINNSIEKFLNPSEQFKPTILPIKGLPSETRGLVNEHFGSEYNLEKWDDLVELGQKLGCDLFDRARVFKIPTWGKFIGCLGLIPLDSDRRPKICGECNNCVFGSQNPPSWEFRRNTPTNNPKPEFPNPLERALEEERQQVFRLQIEEKWFAQLQNRMIDFFTWGSGIDLPSNKTRTSSHKRRAFVEWMGYIEKHCEEENFKCNREEGFSPDSDEVCPFCTTPRNCVNCLSQILLGGDTSFFIGANFILRNHSYKKSIGFQLAPELRSLTKELREVRNDKLDFLKLIGWVMKGGRDLYREKNLQRKLEDEALMKI